MNNAVLLAGTPAFRISDIDITVDSLSDGTPALPGHQVIALIGLLSRPDGIAKLDLSELQRLEDWINSGPTALPSEEERS